MAKLLFYSNVVSRALLALGLFSVSTASATGSGTCEIPRSALRTLEGQLFWITSFLDFKLNSTGQPFNISAAIGSKCLDDLKMDSIVGTCAEMKAIEGLLRTDLQFPKDYSDQVVADHFRDFKAKVVPGLLGLRLLYASIDASAVIEFTRRVNTLSESLRIAVERPRPQAFASETTEPSSCSGAPKFLGPVSAYDCALYSRLRSPMEKSDLLVIASSRPDLLEAALPSIVSYKYAGRIKNYDSVLDLLTSDLHPKIQASGLVDLYLEMKKHDHLSGTKLLRVVDLFPDTVLSDKDFVSAAEERPEVAVALAEFQRIKKLVQEVEAERAAAVAQGGGVKVTTSGICSWYGAEGEIPPGWPTACGNPFNRFDLAAAQPDVPQFPCQTRIRVTNDDNGRTVDVTVNDKGPQASTGRILDLTYEAFGRIENRDKGLTKCHFVTI